MKSTLLFFPAVFLGVVGGMCAKKIWLAKYREQKVELQTSKQESDLLYNWLLSEQGGKNLAEILKTRGYQSVAVFGMKREGRLLADILGGMVSCGVELDNSNAVHEKLTIYRLGEDPLPPVDCMVVCDLERIPEKIAEIRKQFDGSILTLAEVLAL